MEAVPGILGQRGRSGVWGWWEVTSPFPGHSRESGTGGGDERETETTLSPRTRTDTRSGGRRVFVAGRQTTLRGRCVRIFIAKWAVRVSAEGRERDLFGGD